MSRAGVLLHALLPGALDRARKLLGYASGEGTAEIPGEDGAVNQRGVDPVLGHDQDSPLGHAVTMRPRAATGTVERKHSEKWRSQARRLARAAVPAEMEQVAAAWCRAAGLPEPSWAAFIRAQTARATMSPAHRVAFAYVLDDIERGIAEPASGRDRGAWLAVGATLPPSWKQRRGAPTKRLLDAEIAEILEGRDPTNPLAPMGRYFTKLLGASAKIEGALIARAAYAFSRGMKPRKSSEGALRDPAVEPVDPRARTSSRPGDAVRQRIRALVARGVIRPIPWPQVERKRPHAGDVSDPRSTPGSSRGSRSR